MLTRLLFLMALLLLPVQGWGAIALDTGSGGGDGHQLETDLGDTSHSFSYTTSSGTDRAMVAFIAVTPVTTVPTITYNSVSLGSPVCTASNGTIGVVVRGYVLAAPASGANTFAVTTGAAADVLAVFVSSWTGVDQTTPNRTASSAVEEGGNTTVTVTASSAQSGDMVVDGVMGYTGAVTVDGSQTTLDSNNGFFGGTYNGWSSYESATGSTVMSGTVASSGYWGTCAIPLIPASGGGGGATPKNLMLMGVGP